MSPYVQELTPDDVDRTMEKLSIPPEGMVKGAVIVELLDPGSFWNTAPPTVPVEGQGVVPRGNSPLHSDMNWPRMHVPPLKVTVTHVPAGGGAFNVNTTASFVVPSKLPGYAFGVEPQ